MWAHAVCINWIPEVWFKDDKLESIEGSIPQDRFALKCCAKGCSKPSNGCMIQCDFKACGRSLHVRCAIKNELIKRLDIMKEELGINDDNEDMPVFCHEHK